MDETFDCWTVAKNPFDYHLYFQRLVQYRCPRHGAARSQSSVHYSVQRWQRDSRHPQARCRQADPPRHPRCDSRGRSVSPGDAGAVSPECQPRLRRRPGGHARCRRPELSRKRNSRGARSQADAKNRRHGKWPRPRAGSRCATTLRTPANSCGPASIILANRAAGRRRPPAPACSIAPARSSRARFERQSWWSDKPMARIARRVMPDRATPADPGFDPLTRLQTQFADWTPKNLDAHEETVEVYSNCDTVELLLNGQSLGSKTKPENASPARMEGQFCPRQDSGDREKWRHDRRAG